MFKSMRLRLLGWYVCILFLVVAGYGTVLYSQVRKGRLDEVDADLQAAARVLEGVLRGFPQHVLDGNPPPAPRPGGGIPDHRREAPPPRPPLFGRPPPPRPRGGEAPAEPGRPPPWDPWERPPPPRPGQPPGPEFLERRLETALDLPDHFAQRFGEDGRGAPFFVVWLANGDVYKASPLPAGIAFPECPSQVQGNGDSPRFRQVGPIREVILMGPGGSQVLVGRSIQRELNQLHWLTGQLLMTGVVVLAVGLAGGWLLTNRVTQPIRLMSAAAANISASNLAQRIDLKEVDSELGKLASILNGMFTRLEAAFERQARFTADASHELRTPLAIIHSHAELALSRARTPEEYQAALQACIRASRRMKGLVEGLLTLARADAGKLEMKRHLLDLGALVKDTANLLGPVAEQKKVSLSVESQPIQVVTDGMRLAQVITNLVTNAISYNRSGGLVLVGLKADGKEAVISVADTGCGIPEEDRPHVFERFYRADKARSRELGGCGLGLAICKSIIEALGGSITFTSERNKGTTFFVRLPIGTPSQHAKAKPLSSSAIGL